MYKMIKRLLICLAISMLCWSWSILSEQKELTQGVIRFHVVANSDDEYDQKVKLQVRDAVINSIQEDMQKIADIAAARDYIQENLSQIQMIANNTLQKIGVEQNAIVTFCRETFDIRHYDTFSLPAGVYDSLRIIIGEGAGHNWWCVTFPSFCIPATSDGFEAVAADAGLSRDLVDTLSHNNKHRIRFYVLDKIGSLQNIVLTGK